MTHIVVSKANGLAELVLNRPKVNAMNTELLTELVQAFQDLEADPEVKGVLLRGEGKCLSAGLDLKEVSQLNAETLSRFLAVFDEAFAAAFAFPKPLAVAVTGHAIAGGLVLALCGDYVAFSDGPHQHGLTELVVGVPFPAVALEIIKHSTNGRGFRSLVYEAETKSPQQLFEWGIGDALGDDPIKAARAWLAKVTARPLATFDYVKRADRQMANDRIERQTLSGREELVKTMLETRTALFGS